MLWFFIGLVVGYIITIVMQGASAGRYYFRLDGDTFKDITETARQCTHALEARQMVNGVAVAACAHCTAVLVCVTDLQKVHYEQPN